MPKEQAAQNQHYVPKFILRNFLANPPSEQVHVFCKSTGKGFTTSIKNVMAERRFHDFMVDENYLASFEEGIGGIEKVLLPTYRNVVEARKLDGTPDQKAALATLIAFQMLRTRTQRDQFVDTERQISEHLAKFGGSLEDIEGYQPFTEDRRKLQHVQFLRNAIGEFAQVIATKDFLLLEASKGRSFYLSDNPVNIHNSMPSDGFFGNLGLACLGVEIYMPLTADLLLCAWCPSLLADVRTREKESLNKLAGFMLSPSMIKVQITQELERQLDQLKSYRVQIQDMLDRVSKGEPLSTSGANMDFQNSLQVGQAREYVVCKSADFEIARRFTKEFPKISGRRVVIS